MIPTGNMLTESLMAAAAERKRKKSVSASIRYLAADKPRPRDANVYLLSALLVVAVGLLFVVTALYLSSSANRCVCEATVGGGRNATRAEEGIPEEIDFIIDGSL